MMIVSDLRSNRDKLNAASMTACYMWAIIAMCVAKSYHVIYADMTMWYANYWYMVWVASSLFSLFYVIPISIEIRQRAKEVQPIPPKQTSPQEEQVLVAVE